MSSFDISAEGCFERAALMQAHFKHGLRLSVPVNTRDDFEKLWGVDRHFRAFVLNGLVCVSRSDDSDEGRLYASVLESGDTSLLNTWQMSALLLAWSFMHL